MSAASRLGRIFAELPFWQSATVDQRQTWAHAALVANETAQINRELILAHPDLAEKMAALFDLSDRNRWNGYIPPELPPDERAWLSYQQRPQGDGKPCATKCKHPGCSLSRSMIGLQRHIALRVEALELLDEARRRAEAA